MKTSERLMRKLKLQFPDQCSHLEHLYRVHGINDGVKFSWSAYGKGSIVIFSYDTMTECLKNNISIVPAIFNGEYRGWLVGID